MPCGWAASTTTDRPPTPASHLFRDLGVVVALSRTNARSVPTTSPRSTKGTAARRPDDHDRTADQTGTLANCRPSVLTTRTEATCAGSISALPLASPAGDTSQPPATTAVPSRPTTSSWHRSPAGIPPTVALIRIQPAAGTTVTLIRAPVLGSVATAVRVPGGKLAAVDGAAGDGRASDGPGAGGRPPPRPPAPAAA